MAEELMSHAVLIVGDNADQDYIEQISARFKEIIGNDLSFELRKDPGLLGGFIAKIDGKIYDASLRNQLDQIRLHTSNNRLGEKIDDAAIAKTSGKSLAMEKLQRQIDSFSPHGTVYDSGSVASLSDSVAFIDNFDGRSYGELLRFDDDVFGMAMELSEKRVGAVLFSGAEKIKAGSNVSGSGRVMEIPVGDEILGHVIDPLGRPLDGEHIDPGESAPIERPAPSITDRDAVNESLATGLLAIDSMIPIGRGQRELIIGDRQTGKTQIAIDTILNQRDRGVICVYCAIGQKASSVTQVIETLSEADAMRYSVVVSASASDSAALQYIAPYSACAVAEYFMYKGKDVLIVYDDLSKHAVAYRTMSLLLKRPPGREAYPGDVFYLHSRLLERSARLSDEKGGGTMTALPIVETLAGDISAYIPTNIISITDGQIFLESGLFNAGMRPAVNVGLSVSRVGRNAQKAAMRKVSGTLRIDLAQYHELAIFTQFGSDIDSATKQQLDKGERLTQLLKQDKQKPLKLSEQVVMLLAFQSDSFEKLPSGEVGSYSKEILEALHTRCFSEMSEIEGSGDLSDETKNAIMSEIEKFTKDYIARIEKDIQAEKAK